MTEAMPFLQKYDITFLRPPTITPRLFVWKGQIRIFKVLCHAKRKLCVFACEKRAETQYIRLTCAAFVI